MPRSLAAALLAVAACAGRGDGERRAPATRPPDARLVAAFEGIVRESAAAAERARTDHATAAIRARIEATDRLDFVLPPTDSMPVIIGELIPPPSVELRFQRGDGDYPEHLVDLQANAAVAAITRCAGRADHLALFDRVPVLSITVRIDDGEPQVIGRHGADGEAFVRCIERELDIISADGLFTALLHVRR